MSKKNVTFQDIADYTKFSKTTISRFFNNPETLAPKSREAIREALEALQYQENKVGRILAKGRTEIVGVLIPNFFLDFYPLLTECLLNTYERFGYKFLIFRGSRDAEAERRILKELLAYQVDGLVVISHTLPSMELASLGVPVVVIDREDFHVDSVSTNSYAGGVMATELLARCGCDVHIHVNSVIDKNSPSYGRLRGFEDTCSRLGLRSDFYEIDMGDSFDVLKSAVKEVSDSIEDKYPGLRKGVFLSNDTLAHAMLNCLCRKYGGFPDEYRMVGFDNSRASEESIIPISTIGQQTDRIAEAAMEILSWLIEEKNSGVLPDEKRELVHRMIPPVLYQRETAFAAD